MKKTVIITIVVSVFIIGIMFLAVWGTGAFHNHTVLTRTIKEADCNNRGQIERYCSKCDWTELVDTPALFHDWWYEKTKKPSTCTEDGMDTYRCKRCGETEERTSYASHSFVDNECTLCHAVKSDLSPDTWYQFSENNVLKCQNAQVTNAVSMSKGETIMVTYYPVCKDCHICGTIQLTGVSIYKPVSETYYCKSCKVTTYARFEIVY